MIARATDLAGAIGTQAFNTTIVPEPGTLALVSCGLVGLAIRRRTPVSRA